MKLNKLTFGLVSIAAASPVFAAVPTEVTTAITTQSASAAEYGLAFIGLAVAAASAGIAIKWVKKLLNKAT